MAINHEIEIEIGTRYMGLGERGLWDKILAKKSVCSPGERGGSFWEKFFGNKF